MELIVKIGADQQGLQQMAERIKNQFRNSNVSMPASWQPHNTAMQQYGGIMQSAASGGGFSQFKAELSTVSPMLGEFAGKITALAGPLAAIGGAFAVAGGIIKGIASEISASAGDVRTSRISGMSPLMARRLREAGSAAGMEDGAPQLMINRLNASVGDFNSGNKEKQKLFGDLGINPSGMSVDDLIMQMKEKFAGIKNPDSRARIAKGLMGRNAFEAGELLGKLNFADSDAGVEGAIGKSAEIKMAIKKIWRNVSEAASEVALRAAGVIADSRAGVALRRGAGVEGKGAGAPGVAGVGEGDEAANKKDAEELVKARARWQKAEYERLGPEMKLGMLNNRIIPDAMKNMEGKKIGTLEWGEANNDLRQAQHDAAELTKQLAKEAEAKKKGKHVAGDTFDDKPLSFAADSLSQAGLFAGSSLTMNPNLTVAQEQLSVLQRIEANTGKGGPFS